MNPLERFRSENDDIFSNDLRKTYKETLTPSTKFLLILRTPHSLFISFEQNLSLSHIDIVKHLQFSWIDMPNNTYAPDVVLFEESEEDL